MTVCLDESQSISGNQEFMINLITNSLLCDNILQTFLQKAIKCKILTTYNIQTNFLFLTMLISKLFYFIFINIFR